MQEELDKLAKIRKDAARRNLAYRERAADIINAVTLDKVEAALLKKFCTKNKLSRAAAIRQLIRGIQ